MRPCFNICDNGCSDFCTYPLEQAWVFFCLGVVSRRCSARALAFALVSYKATGHMHTAMSAGFTLSHLSTATEDA